MAREGGMKRGQQRNPEELHRFERLNGKANSVVFSPDGQFVLLGSAGGLSTWRVRPGQAPRRFTRGGSNRASLLASQSR